jgi:hypothetical protein
MNSPSASCAASHSEAFQGGVSCLVDEGFLEYPVCRVLLGLPGVYQKVFVTPAEGVVAQVNPDGLDVLSQALGQAADDGRVLQGFRPGRVDIAELRVHLYFYVRSVAETCIEQESVQVHPVRSAVVHASLASTGIGKLLVSGRIGLGDYVRIEKNRAYERWGCPDH